MADFSGYSPSKYLFYFACLMVWQVMDRLKDGPSRSLVTSASAPYVMRLLVYDPTLSDDGLLLRCRQDGARYLVFSRLVKMNLVE